MLSCINAQRVVERGRIRWVVRGATTTGSPGCPLCRRQCTFAPDAMAHQVSLAKVSFKRAFCNLPVAVRGSASTKRRCLGTLYLASRVVR